MKVHIYRLDMVKENKGELIGVISYINGKVKIDIDDEKLHEILKKKVLNKGKNGKSHKNGVLNNTVYYISTPELIEDLNLHCWKSGYITEIVE